MNRTCATISKFFAASFFGLTLSLGAFAQVPLINPSFETPVLDDGQTISPLPEGFGWTVRGNVELSNGVKGTVEVPMGRQWVQMRSGTTISQQVSLQAGFSYYVSLHAMAAAWSPSGQTIRVSLNGVPVAPLAPTSTLSQQTFASFSISTTATYTLQIELPDPPSGSTASGNILIDNIVLNQQGTNSAPSVAISTPVHGRSYPDVFMTVHAAAIDPDGSISKVEFYDGATLLGTSYSLPYQLNQTFSTIGTKNLTAKAYDNLNLTTTSTPVVISHSAGTAKPYVANGGFEYPRLPFASVIGNYPYYDAPPWQTTGGFVASQGALVPGYSNVWAYAFSGRQSGFADGQYIGAGIQVPITLPAGQYGVSFSGNAAYNNFWNVQFGGVDFGGGGYPATRHVATITSPGGSQYLRFYTSGAWQQGGMSSLDDVKIGPVGPPVVTVTAAAPSTTFVAPAAVRLMVNSEVYDATITQVEIFKNVGDTTPLVTFGAASALPAMSFDWLSVTPGTYQVFAKVTDSKTRVTNTQATPLTITVGVPTVPTFFNAGFEYGQDWNSGSLYGPSGWTTQVFYTCYYCAIAAGKGFSLTPAGTVPPEGIALALLKGGGWMQQQVYMPAGNYKIGFKASQLGGGSGQNFQVLVNGATAGTFNPGASFADYLTAQYTIASAGLQTVKFESTTPGVSTYVGIDSLSIVLQAPPLNAPTVTAAFAPASTAFNGTSTLSISVQNANSGAITNAAFSIAYPAGLVNSATPSTTISGSGCAGALAAAASGSTMSLTAATIPANTTCVFSAQTQGTSAGAKMISSGPVTSANAPNSAAGSATLTVASPLNAPTVSASFSPSTIGLNGTSTYTITVTNGNATALTGAAFANSYPSNVANSAVPNAVIGGAGCSGTLTATPNSSNFVLSTGTIPASGQCTYSVQVKGTAEGSGSTTMGAVSSSNAPSSTSAGATLVVYAPPVIYPGFAPGGIQSGTTFGSGGTIWFNLYLSNPSTTTTLTGVSVTSVFPTLPGAMTLADTNVTFQSNPGTCLGGSITDQNGSALTAGSTGVKVSFSSIAPGKTCLVFMNVTAVVPGLYTSTTGVPQATGPIALSGVSASASTTVSGTLVAAAFAPQVIGPGGTSTYTVTVTNSNPMTLTGVTFTTNGIYQPNTSTPNAAIGGAGCTGTLTATPNSDVFSLASGTIPANSSCTYSVQKTYAGPCCGSTTYTSNVTSSNGPTGPWAYAGITVNLPPTIAKTFNPTSIAANGSSTLSLTLSNTSTVYTSATVTDVFPTSPGAMTLASTTITTTPNGCATFTNNTGGALSVGSVGVKMTLAATLYAGATCQAQMTVTAAAGGVYNNTTTAPSGTTYQGLMLTGSAASASVTVQAPQTITFNAQPPQGFVNGGTFALNPAATASSGLAVTYSSSTPAICTISGATVTIVTGGTCTIAANQAGNASFFAAPQVTQSVTINRANQTIAFAAQASQTYSNGGQFAINPLATASPSGLSVTYTSTTPGVCTISGTTVTKVTAGTCTIAANQAGNANYNAAIQVTQGITISATLPGVPTSASATPGNAQATVTFAAPASNGGSPITGYTVTSSPAGGVDSNAGTAGLSHVITGLSNGTAYTFTVKATNAAGTGGASLPSNIVTPATLPGAPTIGTATAGALQATVTFTAPASNGGSAITGYTVTSIPPGGVDTNAGSATLSHYITGLTAGTSYRFTVQATNGVGPGPASAQSNAVVPFLFYPTMDVFTASASNIALGGTVNFTVGVRNSNPVAVTNVSLSTTHTAGLVNGSAAPTVSGAGCVATPSATVGGSTVSFTAGAIPANTLCTYQFQLQGTAAGLKFTGPFAFSTNTITSGSLGNPYGVNIYAPPTATKTFSPTLIATGGTSVLSLTLRNPVGNPNQFPSDAMTNVLLTDVFPFVINGTTQMTLKDTAIVKKLNGVVNNCATVTKMDGVTAVTAGDTLIRINAPTLAAGDACEVQVNVTANAVGDYDNITSAPQSPSPAPINGVTTHAVLSVKQSQTINFSAINAQAIGQSPVTLTAVATSGLPVSYVSTTPSVCSISGNTAVLNTTGTCSITASQNGNATWLPATSVSQSFNVTTLLTQTISFTATGNKAVGDAPVVIAATATSGLPVTFSTTTSTSICTLSVSTVTLVGVGTCVITGNQAGNSTYNAATPVSHSIQITGVVFTSSSTITSAAPLRVGVGGSISVGVNPGTASSVAFSSNPAQSISAAANGGNTWTANWTPTNDGVYLVTATATTPNGPVTKVTEMVVAQAPGASPITIPTSTSSVGASAGSFAVSDLGAAQYSIPIAIPPGIGGIQPSIGLSYSSQGGNGHVGMGWAVSGLSAVTRCPKTIAQDSAKAGINYDINAENDAYCLDGQRLIAISTRDGTFVEGTTTLNITIISFRTEIDRFDRIEGYQARVAGDAAIKLRGPLNFKVWTKGGQIMEYGSRWWRLNNGDVQKPFDSSRENTASLWPLDKVADRNGNYYVVDYSGASSSISAPARNAAGDQIKPIGAFPAGELYPTQITYTLNDNPGLQTLATPVNRVVFEYDDRPTSDRHVMFDSGGGQHILTKRLKQITTYLDGKIIGYPHSYPTSGYPDEVYPVYCKGTDCGTAVRKYKLAYDPQPATGRSRVSSITECTSSDVCLTPTTIEWSNGATATQFAGSESGHYLKDGDAFHEFQAADVDGDGRTDLVKRYGADGVIQARLSRPSPMGWEERTLTANMGLTPGDPWGFADFNGDGRADFWSIASPDDPVNYFRICMNNLPVTYTVTCTDYNGPANSANAFVGGLSLDTNMGLKHFFLQGDFNGDGRIDLLLYRGITSQAREWDLHWGTETGINPVAKRVRTSLVGFVGNLDKHIGVGDFNGDGRADIISRVTDTHCSLGVIVDPEANKCSTPEVSWTINFSLAELESLNVFQVVPNAPYVIATNGTVDKSVIYDFNGDGLADLMNQSGNNDKWGTVNLCLSAGDGSFASELQIDNNLAKFTMGSLCKTITLSALAPIFSSRTKEQIGFGDFNGDGRTDIITLGDTAKKYHVCLATNVAPFSSEVRNLVGFDCQEWFTPTTPFEGIFAHMNLLRLGDFNGDGKTDLAHGSNGWIRKNTTNGPMPDMATKITNGLGAYTEIQYAPITSAGVYTKGTGASAGKLDIQSPMYVVKTTSSSNGLSLGGTFDTNYRYESLIGQTDGRGLLGFGRKIVQHCNGFSTACKADGTVTGGLITTVTEYEQEWWKAGRIKRIAKYVDNPSPTYPPAVAYTTNLVNEAINTYAYQHPTTTITGTGIAAKIRQVHLVSTTEKSWNLNAAGARQQLPYTVTNTPIADIDEYGNIKSVTAATYEPSGAADGHSKTTTNYFELEDSASWLIGRLSKSEVEHKKIAGDCANIGVNCTKRTSSFTYFSTTGQLKSETIEPPKQGETDESLTVTKTYSYDGFGNPLQVATKFKDNGVSKTRQTNTAYSADGRFLETTVQYAVTPGNIAIPTVSETRTHKREFGLPLRVTDINNIQARNTYDDFGRKLSESIYDGDAQSANLLGRATMAYTARSGGNGYEVKKWTHVGGYSISTFDSLNREVSASTDTFSSVASTDPNYGTLTYDKLATATTTFDAHGRKESSSAPRGGSIVGDALPSDTTITTSIGYDKLGRVISQIQPYSTITTEYGVDTTAGTRSTVIVTQTGAESGYQSTTKHTDSQGRTAKIVDNANGTTSFTYDPTGNLLEVAGPGQIRETMTYDLRGRKKTSTNPNMIGSYTYSYNGAGELISQTDPNIKTTTMVYDDLGRMTSRDEGRVGTTSGVTTTWTYDCSNAKGKPCSVTNEAGGKGATHTTSYDAQSRPYLVTSRIDGKNYNRATLYNAQGQTAYIGFPATEFPGRVDPGVSVRYTYNANGFMRLATNGDTGAAIMGVLKRYADGSLASAYHFADPGASYTRAPIERNYDQLGRLTRHEWFNGTTSTQKGSYVYDGIGNVRHRQFETPNASQNWKERFCYDNMNRLTGSYAGVEDSTLCSSQTAQFGYSPAGDGNLVTKGGTTGAVGTITYGTTARTSGTAAGPHGVNTATTSGQLRTYVYDNNGNFTGDGFRNVSYTPFNLPTLITGSNPNIALGTSNSLEYDYDANHARIKEESKLNSGTPTTTIYVGSGFFERIENSNGTLEYKHYLPGPDGTAGVLTRTVAGPASDQMKYWYKDHLGSPVAEFSNATTSVPLGFDAWGLRRKNTGASTFTASLTAADLNDYSSSRGFTGHQHLDEIGLVHMNGRIYDPLIGRFLQPDPIIEDPYNSQSYNRYTYVFNNPLAHTDPSGFSTWTQIRRPVGAIIVAVITQGMVSDWATWALQDAGMAMGSEIAVGNFIGATAGGFAGGGVGGGNIQSAVVGAFQAAALFQVGEALGHGDAGMFKGNHVARIFAHAAIGCAASGVQGGSCGQGAASAGFAAFAGPMIQGDFAYELAGHSIAGGIGARLAGGKFGNGAVTGAFGYLFNSAAGADSGQTRESDCKFFCLTTFQAARQDTSLTQAVADGAMFRDVTAPMIAAGVSTSALALSGSLAIPMLEVGGGAIVGATRAFGPLKQWLRVGPSYSRALGEDIAMSIRWGASPARGGKYIREIGSENLQIVNQWLRAQRLPGGGWRSADPGHFHLWKL